jgi:hypothetical protein
MPRGSSHGKLLEPGAYPDTKLESCRNRQDPGLSAAAETSGPAQSNNGIASHRGVDQAIDGGGGSHARHHCGDRNQRESRRAQEHANRARKVLPAGMPARILSAVCCARCSAISPSERRSSRPPVAWPKKRANVVAGISRQILRFDSDESRDDGGRLLPVAGFGLQLLAACPREAVETRSAVVLRCAPIGGNRALILQPE